MSRLLTSEDFAPHVGKAFRPAGQHRALTLVAIETGRFQGMESRQAFTLILAGPPGDVLPEGSYDVTVDAGPEFSLYIAPIHTTARDRQDYQVVFG
jgi:hypothetical protein